MRFRPWPKPEPYRVTSSKRAAFKRKQRLKREALPLFAEMIAEGQHNVEEEMARRHIWWEEREHEQRAQRAVRWRKARDRLFALSDPLRRTVRDLWRNCPYPADPTYLLDLLHQIAIGRVDPHRPPWVFDGKLAARITPNPLNDPHESYYTSSSHRLRDSHVGRSGHWIDLEVRGDCSDAELDLIRHLAQEADTRPVVVRHVEALTPTNGEAAP